MRRQITIVLLTVVCSIMLYPPFKFQFLYCAAQSKGKIKGTVINFNETVWPGISLIFDNGKDRWKVNSDEEGSYKIELPTGIYKVTIDSPNFFPFRRAAFQVQPGVTTMISIMPVARPVISVLSVPPRSMEAQLADNKDPFKYESFFPRERFDLLVQFANRRSSKSIVEYTNATVSYDTLTIYADKVWLNKKTFYLEAYGNVIFEDGTRRVRVKRAEVNFQADSPIPKLSQLKLIGLRKLHIQHDGL